MVALIVPTIGIGCAAVAVDTGTWYVEMQMAQKAADAAALGGVPFLPQDLPSAKARALEIAKRNGYNNNRTTNFVDVTLGDKATQLKVSIKSIIKNTFGSVIGVPTITINRSGTADFQGPAPMGSPCNTFGNEPNAGSKGVVQPTGTAQSGTPPDGCSRNPLFWATVFGPDTEKVSGDRYQTEFCGSGTVDGCTSGTNDEYDEFGYVFVVKVDDEAVNTPVNLQIYDPLYVNVGTTCGSLPSSSSFPVDTVLNQNTDVNPWVQNKDAVNRYSKNGSYNGETFAQYCTGDNAGSSNGSAAMTTSFVLRQQTDTQNPKIAPVQNDTGGSPCVKQYGTYNAGGGGLTANPFKAGASGYNAEVAEMFHNWVSLCTFTPQRSGDYYLQVRTNISMGGSGGTLVKSGNPSASDLTGNTMTGAGENAFALRAVTTPGKENAVAVSGYNHMPIFVNAPQASAQFHLIRVLPGAAGQKISFSYFDAGDATGTGSVRVQVPGDATGSITTTPFPGGCTAYGGSAGGSQTSQVNYSDCNAPFEKIGGSSTSKNNGRVETITIPIPADYSCNFNDYAGCWYRVTVGFGSGSVTDVTTWDATVVGDPVRLIK